MKLLIIGLEEVCKDVKINVEEIMYVFVGFVGYGKIKEVLYVLEVVIKNVYSYINYILGNDVEIVLVGFLNGEKGINIIVGIGLIV